MAENTPEKIALDLMGKIANTEDRIFSGADKNVDREWILRTYAQCLRTVMLPQGVEEHLKTLTG